MFLVIILSMWSESSVCTLWPSKGSRKSTHFCIKTLYDNSLLGPQFSKYI